MAIPSIVYRIDIEISGMSTEIWFFFSHIVQPYRGSTLYRIHDREVQDESNKEVFVCVKEFSGDAGCAALQPSASRQIVTCHDNVWHVVKCFLTGLCVCVWKAVWQAGRSYQVRDTQNTLRITLLRSACFCSLAGWHATLTPKHRTSAALF